MIVVDTNVITYLHLPTQFTEDAERLLTLAPDWVAPYLWRSEFRNVLTLYLRKSLIPADKAFKIQAEAENLMRGSEYAVDSLDILMLANSSTLSAYDCEYVALASSLQTKLVTQDKKVLKAFPDLALSISDAVSSF